MSRAGRKRKAGKREPSGRRSRAKSAVTLAGAARVDDMTPKVAVSVAVAARCRHFGITEAQATHPDAGTVIGRLMLAKRITAAQRLAADRYVDAYEAWRKAILARSSTGGGAPASAGDMISESYETWCKAAILRWLRLDEVVGDVSVMHRHLNVPAALDYLLIRNEPHGHLIPGLLVALPALAAHLGVDDGREAA